MNDTCDQAAGGVALALLEDALTEAQARYGSDLHLRAGKPPYLRIDGVLMPATNLPVITPAQIEALVDAVTTDVHREQLRTTGQVDLSVVVRGNRRLRANIYRQLGQLALALRVVSDEVPGLTQLGLPDLVEPFVHLERGLVLLVGATGSGKSTTIASLLNEINRQYAKHIVTIEDPIEYLFREERAIITQRELGTDADTFAHAMRGALREDPDVILLGEMRDAETIETALIAAETGHLVLSTMHAPATAEVVNRITSVFPSESQGAVRARLAQNLRAVIAQRLLPSATGQGRVLACEVMTVSSRVRELIIAPHRVRDLADLIKNSAIVEGMLGFDQCLLDLSRAGRITRQTALQHATSSTDLKLRLEGFSA